MIDHTNTFHAAFEYDSEAKPPLSLVIHNSVDAPVVKQGMSEPDSLSYTSPHMHYPVGAQNSRAEDLNKVAAALRQALDTAGHKEFELQPGEEESHTLDRSTGRMTSVTAASYEVRRYIVAAIAELDANEKKL